MVGITLYMQPLQDITIDSAVSRTQYQFVVESTDNNDFAAWIPPLVQKLSALPRARRRRQRPGTAGHRHRPHHRPCHRRALRHHARDRGQRALRFLRAAHRLDHLLAVESIPGDPRGGSVDPALARRAVGALSAVLHVLEQRTGAAVGDRAASASARGLCRSRTSDSFPRPPSPSIWRRAPRSAARSMPSARPSRTFKLPGKFVTAFQGTAAAFQHVLTNQALLLAGVGRSPCTSCSACSTRASFIRSRFSRRSLRRASAPCSRSDPRRPRSRRARHHRHHPADRHRQEKRHHDDRFRARCAAQGRPRRRARRSPRPRCCAFGRF